MSLIMYRKFIKTRLLSEKLIITRFKKLTFYNYISAKILKKFNIKNKLIINKFLYIP